MHVCMLHVAYCMLHTVAYCMLHAFACSPSGGLTTITTIAKYLAIGGEIFRASIYDFFTHWAMECVT